MSGTSAGARRGWLTRTHQAPPVSAGRKKNPIRQKAGARAHETRKRHQQNREGAVRISNYSDQTFTRMMLRGQITPAQRDEYRKNQNAEYERQMRMNPIRHRSHKGRGR